MIQSVKWFQIKVDEADFKALMRVCKQDFIFIQALSFRKQNTLETGLKYIVLIEFYNEIKYSDIFSKYFSVLKSQFEIVKLVDKWGA